MIVINFGHPLTDNQREQLETNTNKRIAVIYEIQVRLDNTLPFDSQIAALLDKVPLTAEQWRVESVLINLPALASAAVVLIAQLYGRMGHFPSIIRTSPVREAKPPQFEVAEIINLQVVRTRARSRQ